MNLKLISKIILLFLLGLNVSCAGLIKAIFPPKYEKKAITRSGSDISNKHILVVFRIKTDPPYSSSGKVITKEGVKPSSKVTMYFSRDPMILERENETYWAKDFYIKKKLNTEKFYAVKVKADEPFFWLGYNAEIKRPGIPFIVGAKLTGATVLKKWVYGNSKELKGGRAYYLGTVTMHLDERSFKATAYQKFDKTKIKNPIPFEVDMDQGNFAEVKSWFKKKFPKVKNPLTKMNLNVSEKPRARDKFKTYEISM